MNVIALLEELKREGVTVAVSEGQLVCDAPKGTLSPYRVEQIRRHKAQLMAHLQGGNAPKKLPTASPTPVRRRERVVIKDLSRDELVTCIRDLESRLGGPEAVIDEHWGMVDLQVWLIGLEQHAKKTVPLQKQVSAPKPKVSLELALHSPIESLTRNQLIVCLHLLQDQIDEPREPIDETWTIPFLHHWIRMTRQQVEDAKTKSELL